MKKRKLWFSFGLLWVLFLAIFIIVILAVQQSLFFHPWHDQAAHEQLSREETFEEINIDHKGGRLNGWLKYNEEEAKAPLLIFFGGNSQNSSNTCRFFEEHNIFRNFAGYHFLYVDYPGYGLSDGSPSDTSMFAAALRIYDFACTLDCVDGQNVVILGYSIGTGVATYVASQRAANGLILLAPYDRGLSLYNNELNIFHGPLKLLAKYKFDSVSYAKNVQVAPLIIASYDDEVIDESLSLNLAKCFDTIEQMLLLQGVSHDAFFYQREVLDAIYDYLQNTTRHSEIFTRKNITRGF